jgi:hypothetical protein
MQDILALASANLLTPMILCFALGLFAALARSELTIPEAVAKGMSIYLLFSIGFKGGVAVADHGLDATLIAALVAGVILSFIIPFAAFALLKVMTRLSATDAAAVAAHYGSISIVTFVTGSSVVQSAGLVAEGYMVAVAAAMEAPAIISALYLASRSGGPGREDGRRPLARDPAERVHRPSGRVVPDRPCDRRPGMAADRGLHRGALPGRAVPVPAGHGAGRGPGDAEREGVC